MKKFHLIIFLFITGKISGQVQFQKIFGNIVPATMEIVMPDDSGFILVGHSGWNSFNYCFLKLDDDGSLIWNKSFSVNAMDHVVRSAIKTSDGNYLTCGIAEYVFPNIKTYIYLVQTNSAGDTIWTKFLKDTGNEYGFSLKQLNDGNYLITGNIHDTTTLNYNTLLIKIDQLGNIIWSKSYGNMDDNGWSHAIELPLGDLVIVGAVSTYFNNDHYISLTKLDSTGSIFWNKAFGLTGYSLEYTRIKKISDDFFIAGGIQQISGDADALLIKVDSSGNLIWCKSYGGTNWDAASDIQSTYDNNIILAGYSSSFFDVAGDGYILKLDTAGNIIWSKTYGSNNWFDGFSSIIQNSDSGFTAVGRSDDGGQTNAYIIRTDSLGHSGCNENSVTSVSSNFTPQTFFPVMNLYSVNIVSENTNTILVVEGSDIDLCNSTNLHNIELRKTLNFFPNPFHSSTDLKIENSDMDSKNCELKIYNSMGALMRTEKISNLNSYTLHRGSLNDGLYFYELQSLDYELIGSGKFIID